MNLTLPSATQLANECQATSTGLDIPDGYSETAILYLIEQLGGLESCSSWWLGDAIVAASKRYGAAKAAAERSGKSHSTCRNLSSVSEKFELSRRRDTLDWAHHAAVVSLAAEDQDRWLDAAESEGWSSQELRRRFRAAKDTDGNTSLIKPSDNWNFAQVVYGRIDEDGETHGYIPGEIYANCFWYYAPDGGEVCDLMAGSGQAMRVYEDREHWGPERSFNLRLFDRLPRGRYKDQIEQLDATKGLPAGYQPDYIFMDVPYFGQVVGAYSDAEEDIANMDLASWSEAMQAVAASCAAAQASGGLCSVMAPNYCDWEHGRIMTCDLIRQWWVAAGYALHDIAYSTRRIQQAQNPTMAKTNLKAKRERLMLSDIAEIQTFRRSND
jgi:ParB family chromosome partitioning protein